MTRRHARSRRFLASGGAGSTGPTGPAPTLASIYPALGFRRGAGLPVTLTGTNILPGATATINGRQVGSPLRVNSTTLTCTTPTFSGDGAFDVVIINPDGKASAPLVGGYISQQALAWFKQGIGFTPSLWTDMGDLGNNISQATGANQPALLPNYRNGKTAVDFSGGKFMTNVSSSLISAGGPVSLLYAGNGGNVTGAIMAIRTTSPFLSLDIFRNAVNDIYVYSDSAGGLVSAPVNDAPSLADQYASYEVPDRVGAHMVYAINGTLQTLTVNAAMGTESGSTGFFVGSNPSAQSLSMKALEIVILGNLNAGVRAAWQAFAHTEYNI